MQKVLLEDYSYLSNLTLCFQIQILLEQLKFKSGDGSILETNKIKIYNTLNIGLWYFYIQVVNKFNNFHQLAS